MARILIGVPLIILYTLVLGLLAIAGGVVDRKGRLPHAVSRLWSRLILLTCGIRVAACGQENVPAGPAIFASNHGSALDIPILYASVPAGFRFIHKRQLYRVPVLGWSLYFAGHIGIDRQKPFRARRSLKAAAERIRRGTSVLVFPEGTRSRNGRVQEFRRGSFVLALMAGVPVVPISLEGVKRVVPRGFFSLHPGTVRLRIHPSIATAGRGVAEAEALAEEVRQAVIQGCAEAAL